MWTGCTNGNMQLVRTSDAVVHSTASFKFHIFIMISKLKEELKLVKNTTIRWLTLLFVLSYIFSQELGCVYEGGRWYLLTHRHTHTHKHTHKFIFTSVDIADTSLTYPYTPIYKSMGSIRCKPDPLCIH